MTTSTTIYLVTRFNQDGTAVPLHTYFSEAKAYKYIADITVNGSPYSYTVTDIELIGD